MVTGTLKSKVDRLWEEFWTGGITNPITVIEQISYLMFARLLDINESRNEKKAARVKGKKTVKKIFNKDNQNIRWKNFKHTGPEDMLKVVRDGVFPHFGTLGNDGSLLAEYMADAQLMIQKPALLVSAVNMIDALPLEQADTKGDLYEYLLSKLTTAGIAGQFRTPRHIINMMVEIVDPKPTDRVCDPACGTAGFLVSALLFLQKNYTSKDGIIDHDGQKIYTADMLSVAEKKHMHNDMFHGFDFDVTMLRIAAMNMILHGVDNPDIRWQDTLANSFVDNNPKMASGYFDLILANPPFKGSLDESSVHKTLTYKVKTKKTELLFVALMLRMLKLGGRCAVIVPAGVLFGSSKAHKDLRKMLVDENQLEAVISLPSGVFRPYAGVSTAVLVFHKGGKTENVFYYDVKADGFTLDDKRQKIGPANDWQDVDDAKKQWKKWQNGKKIKEFADRKVKAFFVPYDEIAEKGYDLSISHYKEIEDEEVRYDKPIVILDKIEAIEKGVTADIKKLREMLK